MRLFPRLLLPKALPPHRAIVAVVHALVLWWVLAGMAWARLTE